MFDESFGGYVGLLENVLDAVRGLAPLGATGRDGASAVELVEAIKLSIERGQAVDLPLVAQGATRVLAADCLQ
jgi:predicted dehydrogenase